MTQDATPQKARIGIYPGTFDPIHNGHLDVIRRAAPLVDRLIIACAVNAGKAPLLPFEDRVELIRHEVKAFNGHQIEVMPFSNLLVHFAESQGARLIIRGLRAVSDFEFEFQMAANNKRLAPKIETVFLVASENCQWISSRFVKEIHNLGGDIASFVSPFVLARLDQRRGRS